MTKLEELQKTAQDYCEENEMVKNEHGVFIYKSSDGSQSIDLVSILHDYKEYLIENNLIN
jgi:hypothetical protein